MATHTDVSTAKQAALLLAGLLVMCAAVLTYRRLNSNAQSSPNEALSPRRDATQVAIPPDVEVLTPTQEDAHSSREHVVEDAALADIADETHAAAELSPFAEKYARASLAELKTHYRELQITFERDKQVAAAERFASGVSFSEPLTLDVRDESAALDVASPPRPDEILHEEVYLPKDGSGAVNRWTYPSKTEYPELHAKRSELEWLRSRILAGD